MTRPDVQSSVANLLGISDLRETARRPAAGRSEPEVSHGEAQAFYEDFSLAVGERDWLEPNLRHEQLKLLVGDLLAGRSGLRIADIGCGAGVMTAFLRRFGSVTGVDFSTAAIGAAGRYAPGVAFRAGGIEALDGDDYDVVTLFDVLEHIPEVERPDFIVALSRRLAPGGLIFASTPYPEATRHRRETGYDGLQIIDEQVRLPDVIAEAAAAGLQLIQYQAYDVFQGSPEYQAMVLTPERSFGGPPALRPHRLERRRAIVRHPKFQLARRAALAARALGRGDVRTAGWFLRGRPPSVKS
jgi:2-polyprenyl-3-methyl-5-hydroxy-6-metoxy-1,4-benzoquinol methylase